MTPAELTIFIATVRLGGSRCVLYADSIIDSPPSARPLVLAKALAAGGTSDMKKLIAAGNINHRIANLALERT